MKPRKNSHTIHLVSLGCAKNTVDSASMAELLGREGYTMTEHAGHAGVIIVNTCGFIGPARDESFQVLADLAAHKRKGQYLIAAGCLTQRYGTEVARRVPGIDGILGTRRWMDILDVVQKLDRQGGLQPVYHLPEAPTIGSDERGLPRTAVQGGSAYLKIADGCRRPCAFCAIPLIKGTAVSRPMQAILDEARLLAERGIREINLIAQDTTDYGHDLGMKDGLARLLEKMTDAALYGRGNTDPHALRGRIPPSPDPFPPKGEGENIGDWGVLATFAGQNTPISGFHGNQPFPLWIRIMYAYPGYVTDRLIEIMARRPQIVHYLDMPLQHAHPDTLRRMRRPANMDWVYRTLEKMRNQIPDLALRTTFIVGYPGETETEFQALLDFVKDVRFDRVGTFQFSYETGTPSEPLGDPIPAEVKEERYNRLMELQQGISLEINQSLVGKVLPVLIEGQDDASGLLVGRSYRDAPEIDGIVLVEAVRDERVVRDERAVRDERGIASRDAKYCVSTEQTLTSEPVSYTGKIVPVRITGAMAYDLNGTLDIDGGIELELL